MVGLVADDLTGACDSAAPFLRSGPVAVMLWPPRSGDLGPLACLAVSTDSRSEEAEVSRQRASEAAAWVAERGAGFFYRKVDSAFRGNQVADLEGTLDARSGTCVLAPALPDEGRVTRNGIQLWPGGEVDLRRLFAGLGPRVEVRDAESAADLDRLAAEVLAGHDLIPAGSAGLAAALAAVMAGAVQPTAPARPRPPASPLALIGSPAAAAQAGYALARGWHVVQRQKTDPVELGGHDALFLCGGSTATGVLRALGASGIVLQGEVAPRVPAGQILDGPHRGLPVALKSGHFGSLDVIHTALTRLTTHD